MQQNLLDSSSFIFPHFPYLPFKFYKKLYLSKKLKKQKGIKFYYKFLGNIYWLRGEILNKRYLELKYLNSVESKEEANVVILLEKVLENSTGLISIYMENSKIILKKLNLNKEQLKEVLENIPYTLVENDEIKDEEKSNN